MKKNTEENLLSPNDFGVNDFWIAREETDDSGHQHGIYISNSITHDAISTPIYRYLDFRYLVQMIERQELYVSNRQCFRDLRESSDRYIKTMDEAVCKFSIVPSHKNRKFFKEQTECHSQIWNQAVSCWTYDKHKENDQHKRTHENYLMWKSHSDKHFVCRIESSIQQVVDSIQHLTHDIIISDVKYLPLSRFRIMNTPSDIFVKPVFYMDEQEVRIVVLQKSMSDCKYQSPIKLCVKPQILIKEIILSPFIDGEEERILKERLHSVMGVDRIPVEKSMIMEYLSGTL